MKIQIVGVGGYVPPHAVNNERIVRAIPGWTAERIADKTGILERRYLWDFDEETGVTRAPEVIAEPGPSTQICEPALRAALAMAGLEGADLDGLIVSTCTPDQNNFSHDALVLHKRVGMRPEAFAVHHDDGCGGALFALNLAQELIRSGCRRTIAVVGVNMISPLLDRDVYTRRLRHRDKDLGAFLTIYLFGDGAGAIILRAEPEANPGSGLVASYAANEQLDLVVRRSGGGMWPAQPGRAEYSDPAFYVDGQLVAECFGPYLRKAIDGALSRAGMDIADMERFYLHQANKRVLERFVREAGIDPQRVPMNMDRYANTTTAGTLLCLAEDLEKGVVKLGSGAPILMAAIGAGAQCAAHVIRL
jgi:3-oxoacyl-[acyl-carrier-protein] synthase III